MKYAKEPWPVSFYPVPAYPTKNEVLAQPGILKTRPRRWDAKPAVCAALTMTLVTGLAGCDSGILNPAKGLFREERSEREPISYMMIPVFEHGSGRGAYGCMMVAPPVFLSEEEAVQVIQEEAEAQGIHFTDKKVVPGVRFPATNLEYDDHFDPGTWEGSLKLDGYDPALNIGFEFVSQQDVVDWAMEGHAGSTVESFDMKGTAERLADVLENTAVFYDPGADFKAVDMNQFDRSDHESYMQQYEAAHKKLMIEKLREQVRDFLAWLEAQGAI